MTSDEGQRVNSPEESLGQLLGGFRATQAIHVAARLAIFDVLRDGPKTAPELADAVGAHEPSLRRLLGFLSTLGIVAQDADGRFTATAMGDLLRSDYPASERPWALLLGDACIWQPWGKLYEAVISGRPAFEQAYGEPFFTYLDHHPQEAATFNAAMTSDDTSLANVLDAYDFSGFGTIVDVGGGHGALLRGVLERAPRAKGILFDLPSVVAEADQLDDPAVAGRCERIGGDMFQSVPAGGDAMILKRIVHDWSDAEAIQILRTCRKALSDDGKILLVESIRPPDGQADSSTATDLMMLVLVSGRERTEDEFRVLYAAAGFTLSRIIPAGRYHVIEGVRSPLSA